MPASTRREHEQRSRELADSLRNFLIAVNTGGIGAMLLTAGALADHGVNPSWTVGPILFFVGGLLSTGWSIFAAQHRAEVRWKLAREFGETFDGDIAAEMIDGLGVQKFPLWWQSAPWNITALAAFAVGALVAVYKLSCMHVA